MRSFISTALATMDVKKNIFEKFKILTYCPSQSLYEIYKSDLVDLIKDVEVRSNKVYVSFADYLKKKLGIMRWMWVKFYRSDLPLFGDHTTNMTER